MSSYNTASITPGANRLILVAVMNSDVAPVTVPTLSGNGLTYVQVATRDYDTDASPARVVTLFRAMGAAPSAGAITIDFGGTNQNGCAWHVCEFDGVDTSGTNGSGAIVQAPTDFNDTTGTSSSVTLAAFGDATNNAAFVAKMHNRAEAATEETGWTELSDVNYINPDVGSAVAWRLGEDLSATYSWATTGRWGSIAAEIKAAAAGGAATAAPMRTRQLALTGAGL